MARKSNKTAHVLNLLTTQEDSKNESDTPDVPEAPDASDKSGAAAPPSTDVAPKKAVKVEKESSNLLSDVIRAELEKDFAISLGQSATSGDKVLSSNVLREENNGNMSDNIEAGQRNDDDPVGYVTVNIVEDLVKSKSPEFVNRMGGCTCVRCVNDVIAMTLNILPPKYIVTRKGLLFAKISSYEKQHATDLASAMTKACMLVKASPRH